MALAGVAQLIEASSHNWKDAGAIPGQGTPWVVGLIPGLGVYRRQPTDVLSHPCFSFSPPLFKNNETISSSEYKK